MKALLSNSTEAVSFDVTSPIHPWIRYHHTWKKLGTDTLNVCGKPLSVVRYLRTTEGISYTFGGQWDLLYDPVHHVFVRSVFTLIYTKGGGIPQDTYELVSIIPC